MNQLKTLIPKLLALGMVLLGAVEAKAELFHSALIVQMPGINNQLSVTRTEGYPVYLTWVNFQNENYTLYVQQIHPNFESPMLVTTGANPICDPDIEINPWGEGVKLIWSQLDSTGWCLNYKRYLNGNWDATIPIVQGLADSINASAGIYSVCWTSAGTLWNRLLFASSTDLTWQSPTIIDSNGCDNPIIVDENVGHFRNLVYEKQSDTLQQIKSYTWDEYHEETTYAILSTADMNRNPKRGPYGALAFESYQDSTWRAAFSPHPELAPFTYTSNVNANYYNPVYYTFPIPVNNLRDVLYDWLLIFECDSTNDGSEILGILQEPYGPDRGMVNISNMPGDDSHPEVLQYWDTDSTVVAVIWQHETSEGSEIWWARTRVELPQGNVDNESPNLHGFELSHNYPNPFNASTVIRYRLDADQTVGLNIWNIDGQLVASEPTQYRKAGNYTFEWQPVSLSSGLYFYTLSNGMKSITKKCLLVK